MEKLYSEDWFAASLRREIETWLGAVSDEPGVDGGSFLGREGGGGFLEHLHEPGDLDGDGGVADIAARGCAGVGTEGVDDGVAGGVEHDEVGVAGGGAAERGAESYGAWGVVVARVGGELADVECGDDEGLVHDGSDGGVGEEVIEHVAGAAPGGAEDEQDVFVLSGSGGAGLGEDVVGVGFGVQGGGEEERGGEEGGAKEAAGREVHGLSDSPVKKFGPESLCGKGWQLGR